MNAPLYTVDDYLHAFQALLPPGRAWSREPDSVIALVLRGLAGSHHRLNQDANDLLVQAFPATAVEMLLEWEATLGLPGAYGVVPGTTAGRQAAVVAALTDTGGQSVVYFIALAAALGYTITIQQFSAFTVRKPIGAPIASDEWAHTWQVTGSAASAISYTPAAGIDIVQATAGFGIPILEAVFSKYKPAHTVCITRYV